LAVLDAVEDAQQLTDAAHEQTLLIDFDPRPGCRGEDHMVAGLDRHPDADVIPPIEPWPNRKHDPLLGRRFLGPGGNDQAGATDSIGIELLDDHAVKEGAKLVAHLAP
jgi:hypothetical protein